LVQPARKENPAEAGQGLILEGNQDEDTATDTQNAAVLRLDLKVKVRTANRRGEDGAQRWHVGAEGSSAQIREGCLSCVRYRITAKSTRRIAMTTQILMRNIPVLLTRGD